MKKLLVALVALLIGAPAAVPQITTISGADAPLVRGISQFKIGGGGWLVNVFGSPNGDTELALPDTSGFWVRCNALGDTAFRNITVPSTPPNYSYVGGAWAAAVAPTDSNRIYLLATDGYVYVSTDCGRSLYRHANYSDPTAANAVSQTNSGSARFHGPKMAVDPTNADVVYLSTPAYGTWKTTAGSNYASATWTQVAVPGAVPQDSGDGQWSVYGCSFNGTVTGVATHVLTFASVSGVGAGAAPNQYYIFNTTEPSRGATNAVVTGVSGTTITTTADVSATHVGDNICGIFGQSANHYSYSAMAVDSAGSLYIGSTGGLNYFKVTSGGSVSSITTTGQPSRIVNQMAVSPIDDGLWVASNGADWSGSNANVFKYLSGTWTQKPKSIIGSGIPPSALAIDQASASGSAAIVLTADGDTGLTISTDNGSTWTSYTASATRIATDIPWLAQTGEYWSVGNIWVSGDKVLVGQGIGVWQTPLSTIANGFNWYSYTKDIEQLVSHGIANGNWSSPLMIVADRDVFINRTPSDYTAVQGGCLAFCGISGQAWGGGCSAFALNSCVLYGDGIWSSSNSGASWGGQDYGPLQITVTLTADSLIGATTFQTTADLRLGAIAPRSWCYTNIFNCGTDEVTGANPATGVISLAAGVASDYHTGDQVSFLNYSARGGSIAISDAGNYVLSPANNTPYAYYYKNGVWNYVNICNACTGFDANGGAISEPGTGTGFAWAYYLWASKGVAADGGTPGTFYLMNWRSAGAGGGCYMNTNGGEGSWTLQGTFPAGRSDGPNASATAHVEGMKGKSGFLLTLMTPVAPPSSPGSIYRSTDSCASQSVIAGSAGAVGGFDAVYNFAIGAPKAGNTYGSVYVAGKQGSVKGIWRTDNVEVSVGSIVWTYLGTLDSYDTLDCGPYMYGMGASYETYGVFYASSCAGSGQWQGYFP